MAETKNRGPTVYDVRRDRLRELMSAWGGPTSLALKLGYSNASFISQIAGPNPSRQINEKVARDMERKLELPHLYLDNPALGGKLSHSQGGVNEELLARCVEAAMEAVREAGINPSKERFSGLVALVYGEAARTGAVDSGRVSSLVRLMKP